MLPEQKFLQGQVDEIGKAVETKCNQIVKLNIQNDATKNPNISLKFIAQYEQQDRFEPNKISNVPVLSYINTDYLNYINRFKTSLINTAVQDDLFIKFKKVELINTEFGSENEVIWMV